MINKEYQFNDYFISIFRSGFRCWRKKTNEID